jgi:hypothetical protein
MHYTDPRFGKAMMEHEGRASQPVVTRTTSVRDVVVGFGHRIGRLVPASKERVGLWLIAWGEKLSASKSNA